MNDPVELITPQQDVLRDPKHHSGHRRLYGLDWPMEADPVFVDLVLAKKWREAPFKYGNLLDPAEHLLRAARALLTKDQFKISRWTEEHAQDWTHEKFCITWGCAASSKSNDLGLFAVLDWITDPTETLTILASTTSDMLQLRSFESVMRYFRLLKRNPRFEIPGKESKQRLAIINDDQSDTSAETTVKASVKGVAVQKGSVEEARANLQGAHLPYVRLIADELSQMKEAAMEARHNLSIGCKDFRFVGLCNPDSLNDLAGQYSVPVGGWASVDENTEFWRTRWGCVRHHNGFNSPAITDVKGEEKFPHLIKQSDIQKILDEHSGNADVPAVWTMVKGFPPPMGLTNTVLSEKMAVAYKMTESVDWAQDYLVLAALDPAFTSDGDDAILQVAQLGMSVNGTLTLQYTDSYKLIIEASSTRPVVYQISDQVRAIQQKHGFHFSHLAVDDSGTQSVADVIENESGSKVFRVNFSWRPTELPVSTVNPTPAKNVYLNRITEYYFSLVEYAAKGQIRGMPSAALAQMCQRKLVPGKRLKQLESKRDMKKRIKRSPDNADAAVLIAGLLREALGVVPGQNVYVERAPEVAGAFSGFDQSVLVDNDLDGRNDNYSHSGI